MKVLLLVMSLLLFGDWSICFAVEPATQSLDQKPVEPDSSPIGVSHGSDNCDWWETLKGRQARDALLLGMWSLHLDGSGESTSKGENNEENHLFGLQYCGLTAGTFINSHNQHSFYGGLAREVWSYQETADIRFDLGYKLGVMTGYDKFPDLLGMVPFLEGFFGISWKRMGVDLGFTPLGVLTLNFRIDIDRLFD